MCKCWFPEIRLLIWLGTWHLALGTLAALGTWHPRTWQLAPDTQHLAPGTWHPALGTLAHVTWNPVAPGTWHPGTHHLAPDTLAPGIWHLARAALGTLAHVTWHLAPWASTLGTWHFDTAQVARPTAQRLRHWQRSPTNAWLLFALCRRHQCPGPHDPTSSIS
jgi:hypothetical protein